MQLENEIVKAVQNVGINVNKSELFKALFYDRQQYDKGYINGYADAKAEHWIPVSEKLPKETGTYMTTIDYGEYGLATGQRYYHGEVIGWNDECVIAWQPLPEPYERSEK